MGETVSPATFAALYERHARDVYRFALALTRSAVQSEDLTAEAFLRVWQAGSRVELLTVRAYLLAIVRNLYRISWRAERRRTVMPDTLAAPAHDPAVSVELQRVLAALEQLDEPGREILLLRAEGGLTYEEIAILVGGTAQSVRTRAHRARQKLMEVLCPKT